MKVLSSILIRPTGINVLSNLPLQMMLYFNAYYSPLWVIAIILGLVLKVCPQTLHFRACRCSNVSPLMALVHKCVHIIWEGIQTCIHSVLFEVDFQFEFETSAVDAGLYSFVAVSQSQSYPYSLHNQLFSLLQGVGSTKTSVTQTSNYIHIKHCAFY